MQYVQRFSLKPNKKVEFRQWLAKNATLMSENSPKGWTYLGTWFTVWGLGQHDCETRWELADYTILGGGFGNEIFQKALIEFLDFMEPSLHVDATLMKSATDVTLIMGE